MRKLIQGGTIVNEGRSFIGSLIIEDDCIKEIIKNNETPRGIFDEVSMPRGALFYQVSLTTMFTFASQD